MKQVNRKYAFLTAFIIWTALLIAGIVQSYNQGKKAGNIEGKKELITAQIERVNYDVEPCKIYFKRVDTTGVTIEALN